MEASVQYNDFKGTAAADISDDTNLNRFLNKKGVDTARYNAIGAEFYHGYSDYFSAAIICRDKNSNTLCKFNIEKLSHEEFFNLFKRFNVVISNTDINDDDINDSIEI